MTKKPIPLFRCPYCNHGDVVIDTAAVYQGTYSKTNSILRGQNFDSFQVTVVRIPFRAT